MQLVEEGRIDLDADVNRYLDFVIPPYGGQPLTMRNILTHTPGFEDVVKGGFSFSGNVDPLGDVVKRMLPTRVFAPGTTPAYSNYATALAGYIVERVSGMSFDDYVERRIFEPLGMTRSSFRQPLPASLAPHMARGYLKASADAQPFELISVPPAGSLSMSGADGAKFMIAHLNQAAGLLKPQTAQLMQAPGYGAIPRLNRMALGFYEQRINGVEVIAHGGDLIFFHGYLWLLPAKNVGLLLEMNSAGEGAVTAIIRQALFEQFADRYFPAANAAPLVELGTARAHAQMLVGTYQSSRRAFTTFLDAANFLEQHRIGLDDHGRPQVPDLFGGPPRRWIEVEPFLWQDAIGHARLGAIVENGKVVRWSLDEVSPFMVFDRVPWYRDSAWLLPALVLGLALVLVAALSAPIGAISRRCHGARHVLDGRVRKAHRFNLLFAWLVIVTLVGWLGLFSTLATSLSVPDWSIWLLQIVGTLAFIGLFGSTLWRLASVWKTSGSVFAKVWSVLLVGASSVVLWVALGFHLISFGTNY